MTRDEFLKHCTLCGGNWTAMLLTGIKAIAPEIWNALPGDINFSFDEVVFIVNHLCTDTPHINYNLSLESGRVCHRELNGTFTFRKMTEEEANMSYREFDKVYNDIIWDD